MQMGSWSLDAFLVYEHPQVLEYTQDISTKMASVLDFWHQAPGPTMPPVFLATSILQLQPFFQWPHMGAYPSPTSTLLSGFGKRHAINGMGAIIELDR
jgi:hypothetical protein